VGKNPDWAYSGGDMPKIKHYRRCILAGLPKVAFYYKGRKVGLKCMLTVAKGC
jgi:hypothetical protein